MAEVKWTTNTVGKALAAFIEHVQEAEKERIEASKRNAERLDHLYKVIIEGNGDPAILYQVKMHAVWIANVNKFIWIVVTAIDGQVVLFGFTFIGLVYVITKGLIP